MNETELQALLDSGNPDDIDKALKYLEENKEDVTAEPSSGDQGAEQTAADKGTDVITASSAAEEAAPKGITSKNGEHVLPYEVLEKERREKQEMQRQLDELKRQSQDSQNMADQVAAMNKKVELLQGQLTKHGIKPAELAEELQITEDELELLTEYGEVGEVSAKLARKYAALEKQLQSLTGQMHTAPAQAPAPTDDNADVHGDVHKAIAATEGLPEVMADPKLRAQAVALDEKLQADPAFANKPLTARFAEVMKRLAPQIIGAKGPRGNDKQNADMDEFAPPHSLNGIVGATDDVNAPLSQRLSGLPEEQIQHQLSRMTEAEQKQLMAEIGW